MLDYFKWPTFVVVSSHS